MNSIKAKLKQTTTVANYRPERPTPHESKLDIGQWPNFVTASEQKAIKAIFTIFSSEFKTSDVLNTWLQKKWRAQTWLCVWPRSIYQSEAFGSKMNFCCLSIPKRDLNTKKTPPNIEVCPERLRSMLEYWYIERGLLVFVLPEWVFVGT